MFYTLSDQLHSTSVLVNQNGMVNSRNFYYPYGGNRGGSAFNGITTKRFTGQYHEQGLPGGEGLSYYNARWYDSQVGMFISADTIVSGGTVNYVHSPIFAADWQRYALRQMLTRQGKPSAVSVQVAYLCMERDCGDPLYRLFLVFEQAGIAVSYFGTAERTDPIRICPNPDNVHAISLDLQAPDDPRPVLELEHLDPAELPLIHPLTEVSTLTLDSFHETFKASDTACFTVPAKYWEELPAGP